MKVDWKTFGKKLLYPPLWLMLLLTAASTAGLVLVFTKDWTESPVAYGVYAVSFYTVCVLSVFFGTVLPGRYRALRQKLYAHPVGHRYMTDPAFKTHVKLYASLAVNLFYVGVNVLSFLLYRSAWFLVLAAYYTILAVMRFLLVRYARANRIGENRLGELRRARLCSAILLTLNLALSGAVLMILHQNKGAEYSGMLIYVMAGYTFYITIHAVTDLVKYRRYQSPVMTTAKIICLSAALVSILNLETAMFSQFGADMAPENQRLMIALTGAGVSIVVLTMSFYMIAKTAKEIKEIVHDER
ncbi:MAG: hypothetical protein ACI4PC_02425 [Oscillospiraceae bacterium]